MQKRYKNDTRRKWYRVVVLYLLTQVLIAKSWAQRYPSKRSYEEVPLQDSETVITYLGYALACIVVGLIISHITTVKDEHGYSKASNWFFVSIALYFAAFLCAMPLISWVEFIFVGIMNVVLLIIAVFVIGALVYHLIFKK